MSNKHTPFWLSLLNFSDDADERSRIWNGYLGWKLPPRITGDHDPKGGWPQLIVNPPEGGWPTLTEDEKNRIETLAEFHGNHPELHHDYYMDFSEYEFADRVDFSGLTFINCNFQNAIFHGSLTCSEKTEFYAQSWFDGSKFEGNIYCNKTKFYAPVSFSNCCFENGVIFIGVEFMGGASFFGCKFNVRPIFNDSKFEERYFSGSIAPSILVDFRKSQFLQGGSFREVIFGRDETEYHRTLWPERRVDFSDAEFNTTTTFRGAIFADAPAFFNTKLHEDTDFGRVRWGNVRANSIRADYALRAWERLELMMNELEKPLDRHRFFRLKMHTRRQIDSWFLRVINWLFEKTCDYGWGVGRAATCWLVHWIISAVVLFLNTGERIVCAEGWKLGVAGLATSFSNAHTFLFLSGKGGYLEDERKLLEENDQFGLLAVMGVTEGVLGPVFLFFLLLTLRNRFRLA